MISRLFNKTGSRSLTSGLRNIRCESKSQRIKSNNGSMAPKVMYMFSSGLKRQFQEKIMQKQFDGLNQLYQELVELQKVAWKQHEENIRQLKGKKYQNSLNRLEKRIRKMLFYTNSQDDQQISISDVEESKNASEDSQIGLLRIFQMFPKTPFSISESYVFLYHYYTSLISNYSKLEKNKPNTQEDFMSRFSSSNFQFSRKNKEDVQFQFIDSIFKLMAQHAYFDLPFFSNILSFATASSQVKNYEFIVNQKYFLDSKIQRGLYLQFERWNTIQEQYSGIVFQNYENFKSQTQGTFIKKVKKYKGDFEFKIDEEKLFNIHKYENSQISRVKSSKMQEICFILETASKFAILGDKFLLSAQLLLKNYWNRPEILPPHELSVLLKVITIGGRTMKILDDNLFQIFETINQSVSLDNQGSLSQKQRHMLYNLMCYLCLSELENFYMVDEIMKHLGVKYNGDAQQFEKLVPFSVEWYLFRIVTVVLESKYNVLLPKYFKFCEVQGQNSAPQNQNIADFLNKFGYHHIERICPLTHLRYYAFSEPEINGTPFEFSELRQYNNLLYPLPSVFFNPNTTVQDLEQEQYAGGIKITLRNIDEEYKVTYSSNGLYKMLMKCLIEHNTSNIFPIGIFSGKVFKTVNLPLFESFSRKGEKDEFLKKKLKGIKKSKPIKQRKFQI